MMPPAAAVTATSVAASKMLAGMPNSMLHEHMRSLRACGAGRRLPAEHRERDHDGQDSFDGSHAASSLHVCLATLP
jgi:hypothetical protein